MADLFATLRAYFLGLLTSAGYSAAPAVPKLVRRSW